MKFRLILVTGMMSLFAGQAFASPFDQVMANYGLNWVGSVSLGPVWQDAGQSQTFALAPNVVKTYAPSTSTQALADGELFAGVQKDLPKSFQGQLGLAVAVTGDAKPSGNIWDDADPAFNNYTYRYQIHHSHIAIKGKLLLDKGYWATPWVSASLGVGFNNAHGFQNTPLISSAVMMPNFASNTQTSFTYTIGAGLQKSIREHWQAGVGYEFADWGKSQLGRAPGQTLNSGLRLSHLYTNGFLFNLTYLA